jgi:DNA-binding XRE family transcriptional regulator
MPTTLRDKIKNLSAHRHKKVEARARELIDQEMSLRKLRKALNMTQERLAEALGIGQEGVSRLEKRSDLLISTLRSYIEAMGGELQLVATFPDRRPITLSGIAGIDDEGRKNKKLDKAG